MCVLARTTSHDAHAISWRISVGISDWCIQMWHALTAWKGKGQVACSSSILKSLVTGMCSCRHCIAFSQILTALRCFIKAVLCLVVVEGELAQLWQSLPMLWPAWKDIALLTTRSKYLQHMAAFSMQLSHHRSMRRNRATCVTLYMSSSRIYVSSDCFHTCQEVSSFQSWHLCDSEDRSKP